MSDPSGDGGKRPPSKTTSPEQQPNEAEVRKTAPVLDAEADPITQPVGVDEADDLDNTDVLGPEAADFADTGSLGPEAADFEDTDSLGDTGVLAQIDEELIDEDAAEITEENAARITENNSARITVQVGDNDPTDPQHRVPSGRGGGAPPAWDSVEELQRALATPFDASEPGSDPTLEIDAVYARARLRQMAEANAVAEAFDPFEMTGFRIRQPGDDPEQAGLGQAPSTGRFEPPQTGRASAPRRAEDPDQQRRDWSRRLAVGLDAVDDYVALESPWAQFVEELREEAGVEADARLRSSYVFLLANLLRLYGGIGPEIADRLEEAALQTSRPVRTLLLDLVVKHWAEPDRRFVEAVERLEEWDAADEPESAAMRRAGIAVERLASGGVDGDIEQRLAQLVSPPETLPGLGLRAIRAHEQGHRPRAAQIWRQVSRHLREEPRVVLADTAAYFLRGTPGFFDYLQRCLDSGTATRSLLLMMQREAAAAGDHLREAGALRQLVAADVALGRRLEAGSTDRRSRLKEITAARFFRLATLLRGLQRGRRGDPALSNLEPHKVVRDAVALVPRHPLYLRRLARWARERGDLNTCAKSLGTLAMSYVDPRMAALALAELARTIHIGGGDANLVDQYLDEALAKHPGCDTARVARACLALARGDQERLARLGAPDESSLVDVDFVDEERRLIEASEWGKLGRLLEQKLESAVEPRRWSELTFRLAQLHGWFLAPSGDSRLRTEFLEQVLIADASHLCALVEILDLRLARREYAEAAEVVERLAELSAPARDRVSWLSELGGLIEHHLGTPDWAFACFEAALEIEPGNDDAFFGLLRTDIFSSQDAVAGIAARLDAGVAVREGAELSLELVLRVDEAAAAWQALDARFPDQPFWQFVRMCLSVERGRPDPAALRALRRMWLHPNARPLLGVFERHFAADTLPTTAELSRRLNLIKASPVSEGLLVRAMYDARRLADAELSGMLAAIRSRRTTDVVTRATDLAWMAITFMWRGEDEQALRVCEHVLERFPEYVPALKLAKILAERMGRWADVVRWCEREAGRTGVEQLAFENRLLASEVQRKYLGDFDAACQQFRTVLAQDPGHQEAFDKLKPLLLQRGEVDELLDVYENRVRHTTSVADKCEMLNDMADIALHRGKDPQAAIGYFRRALDLDPTQLRSLRILAELHYEQGEIDEALRRYRQAVELTDNDTLLERLWLKLGKLLEEADRGLDALEAYEHALRINPSRADVILDVARLEASTGGLDTALIHLRRLESTASNPEILREGRARKVQYLIALDRPQAQVLGAFRDLLVHHPGDLGSVDALCEYLGPERDDDIDEIFRDVAFKSLREMQGRPFQSHFAIARRLGHTDRAFCLAGVAKVLGYGSAPMEAFHAEYARERRWPTKNLPHDVVAEIVPQSLLPPFLAVLSHSEPALRAALRASPFVQARRRAKPLRGAEGTALEMALRWPSLYGVDVARMLETDEIDGGSHVLYDDGVEVIVDRSWRRADDPTELLVHLGKQLAAWSLGIGMWHVLDTKTRFLALSKLVSHLAPGWGGAAATRAVDGLEWSAVESWLQRDDADELAAQALELSGRLSTQAVEPQFRMVELTLERAACMVLDDPARFLPHTKYLGSEHGLLQQPWSFVFSKAFAQMRKAVGVAVVSG